VNPLLVGAGGLLTGFAALIGGAYLLRPRKRQMEAQSDVLEVRRLVTMYEVVAKDRDLWHDLYEACIQAQLEQE